MLSAITLVAFDADAATITYVNPGPNDSMVQGGFTNVVQVAQPGFFTTTDFLSHPNVFSRADTAIGHGTFPIIESTADARTELGTDLNDTLGTGVRSVFAPITNSFSMEARGQTYQTGSLGNYSSVSFVQSGDAASTTALPWIIHVDPSGGDTPGAPANVTVTGSIAGMLSVAGASVADATWNVATTSFGTVMSGVVNQSVAGTSAISDSGSITFTIPLGTTFELLLDYNLSTSGNGAGASSFSEISASLVEISVLVPPVVLPPMFNTNFLQPIGPGTTTGTPVGPFKANRTIPVKFELRYASDGLLVDDATASALDVRLNVFYDQAMSGGTTVDTGDEVPDTGDSFRYDADADRFMFNLGTKGSEWLPDYSYRIEIEADGEAVGEAFFALR